MQERGRARRAAIVAAAADLLVSDGPAAVAHRAVAARAGVPLAATTYYFTGRDDLIAAAGEVVAGRWADHAERAEAEVRATGARGDAEAAALLVDAVLPPGGPDAVRGTYEHLVGAGRYPALSRAYAGGRDRLDEAIVRLLTALGRPAVRPALLVAVVDGAAVSALSEGRDPHALARDLVAALLAP